MTYIFRGGGGMSDGPLHHHLHSAPPVAETASAPRYRFYAVGGEFPAMAPVADGEEGRQVAGEMYDLGSWRAYQESDG